MLGEGGREGGRKGGNDVPVGHSNPDIGHQRGNSTLCVF